MTHRNAVALILPVTLLWSTAGVVTGHLDSARTFEVTFCRSAFNAVAITLTSVANVLVTMSSGPLLSRVVLGHRLATRTWAAFTRSTGAMRSSERRLGARERARPCGGGGESGARGHSS